jgi:hypothetical protein
MEAPSIVLLTKVGPINSLKSISVSLAGLAGKVLWNGFMIFTDFRKSKQFGVEADSTNDLTDISAANTLAKTLTGIVALEQSTRIL